MRLLTATTGAESLRGTTVSLAPSTATLTATASTTVTMSSSRLTVGGTVTIRASGTNVISTGLGADPQAVTLEFTSTAVTGASVAATSTLGQLELINSSTLSSTSGDVTATANAAEITLVNSTVSAAANAVLHAEGGSVSLTSGTVTANTAAATVTASTAISEINSQITTNGTGNIELTAQNGNIVVDPSMNKSTGGSIIDEASGSYIVQDSIYTAGVAISLTADSGYLEIDASTMTALGRRLHR